MLRRLYTIRIDTREKLPLVFPPFMPFLRTTLVGDAQDVELLTVPSKMPTADYCLVGYEDITLIERKGSLREIANNCLTDDRHRLRREFERLRYACLFPLVLVVGSMPGMLRDVHVDRPYRALDALMRLLAEYRLPLLFQPGTSHRQRADVGRTVARILVNNAVVADQIDLKKDEPPRAGDVSSETKPEKTP